MLSSLLSVDADSVVYAGSFGFELATIILSFPPKGVHVPLLGGAGTRCPHSSRAHEPGGMKATWNSTHRLGLYA